MKFADRVRYWLLTWSALAVAFVTGCANESDVVLQVARRLPARRSPGTEKTVKVSVGMRLQRMNFIADTNMMHIDGFLLRSWNDERLRFDQLDPCESVLDGQTIQHMWIPKLNCANGEAFSLHDGGASSTIQSDGTVTHMQRFDVMAPCFTDALRYPFGNTSCALALFGERLNLSWHHPTPEPLFTSMAPAEHVGDLKVARVDFSKNTVKRVAGDNDELVVDIYLTRFTNKIVLLFYLPSMLIVFVSWLSLVLGPMAITRAVMIIGSFILLLIHYASNMADLPRTTGITAIDIWKVGSMIFVTGTLLELVVVTCMASVGRSRRLTRCWRGSSKKSVRYTSEPLYEELNDLRHRKSRITCSCCRYTALFVDFLSMILFGVGFLFLAVAYFVKYDSLVSCLNDFKLPTVAFD